MIDRVCSLIKQQVPDRERGLLAASGTTVPTDGTDGYLPGCSFKHTDGGAGTAVYVNEGSVTSCDFNPLSSIAAVYSGSTASAITIAGTYTNAGIDFTGTFTGNVIDFTDATVNPAGSNGPCFIRLGTYGSPYDYGADDDQSGVIRLYTTTSGSASYDRGLFVYCETTAAKGVCPVAGLAEANNTGTPAASITAAQFIAHLGAQSSGAHLKTVGALPQWANMYGAWLKVAAAGTAVCDSGSRVCAVWLDNQMSGTVSGDEFGIFATTGASQPDAFMGFSTSSSGYKQFLSFDSTFNSGAGTCATTDAVPGTQDARLLVSYDGVQYYIALYR